MKNYEVEAIMRFTDKEEGVRRDVGDKFVCTESRFNLLKQKNAVKLIEIIKEDLVVTEDELQEAVVNRETVFDAEIKTEDLEIKPKKKKNSKK